MTTQQATRALLDRYYTAFNAGDAEGMLACLSENVAHDINQGARETGKAAFRAFLARMDAAYAETLADIVIMTNADGSRAAAELTVHGQYLKGEEGLPVAHGQRYLLPAGAFLTMEDGLIARISVYYNLADWIAQVSA